MVSDDRFLGYWQQEPGQHGLDIHAETEITVDEFNAYLDAIGTYRAVTERNTYALLQRSSHLLLSMRDMYANLERVGGEFRAVNRHGAALAFMEAVTNWLASTRLYLVTEEDSMSRHSGGTGAALEHFRATTAEVFDSNVGYRFLYNLRDYAQHCGPPLGGLVVATNDDGRRSLELYLSRSALLLANFKWNRHAKQLLEAWPEQILLLPLIEEAMLGFSRIEETVLGELLARCHSAIPIMSEGIARAATTAGHPAIFRLPEGEPVGGDAVQMSWQSFPESSSLEHLESALVEPDPIATLRRQAENPMPYRSPDVLHSEAQAAAVIGSWLEHGPGTELADVINQVLQEDHDVNPLISGLVNLSGYMLAILSRSLGISSSALLGSFLSGDDDNTEPDGEEDLER